MYVISTNTLNFSFNLNEKEMIFLQNKKNKDIFFSDVDTGHKPLFLDFVSVVSVDICYELPLTLETYWSLC